jgi:ATP-dependent DNA helicase UvrD/PcrA
MDDLFEHAKAPAPGIQLNLDQRAAVQHQAGPLVVVAGAGTGKTRVITERVRYLLDTQPDLTGSEILALTFTDKAAAEMKHRVVAASRDRGESEAGRAEAVTLSTFHSFCNELLQEVNPDLKPIDEIDHWILLRRNLPSLHLEHFRRLSEPGQFLRDFVEFFSRCQDELVSPDEYQRFADQQAEDFRRVRSAMPEEDRPVRDMEIAKLQEIARAYRASDLLLRERKLLTFGTQIMDAVVRLREDEVLREKLRARYRYILVDEFQDTNIAQLELLWQLGGERPNLVVVGDHRQAIYRFRGASFGSFTIFLDRFAAGSPATMKSRSTFRSTRSRRGWKNRKKATRCGSPRTLPTSPKRNGWRTKSSGCIALVPGGAPSPCCTGLTRTATGWWKCSSPAGFHSSSKIFRSIRTVWSAT